MLKFCSLRRGNRQSKSRSNSISISNSEAPPPELPAKRVSKSSSLRLQDVALSDAQLLNVLKAQRARGPLILALSSPTAKPETEACHHCGTPFLTRKSQALQNGGTTATATATASGELLTAT
ncbi:hypothetical protein ACLKA7_014582 [Drosophila subpalustris]